MINETGFFFGEVRNISDPWRSGRVQIRIYGHHDDEQNIKDEHLPWATTIHPITSAATMGVGIIPTGLIVGSQVFGTFIDKAHQNPVILGSYPRAAKLTNQNDNAGGQEGLDPSSAGKDVAGPNKNGSS